MTYQLGKDDKSIAAHFGIKWGEADEPTLRKCASVFGIDPRDMDRMIFSSFWVAPGRCGHFKNTGELCTARGPLPDGAPRCQYHSRYAFAEFQDELLDAANSELQKIAVARLMDFCEGTDQWSRNLATRLRSELAEAVKDHLSTHGRDDLQAIKDIWS